MKVVPRLLKDMKIVSLLQNMRILRRKTASTGMAERHRGVVLRLAGVVVVLRLAAEVVVVRPAGEVLALTRVVVGLAAGAVVVRLSRSVMRLPTWPVCLLLCLL